MWFDFKKTPSECTNNHTYNISSHCAHASPSTACGSEAYFTADTEGSSARLQEAALPGWRSSLISSSWLPTQKCGPQSLSLWHTQLAHSFILAAHANTTLGLSASHSLSPMIKKQYPAYSCKLVRHPHSFAVKGKWPCWWVIAFTHRRPLFNTLKSLKAKWSRGSRHGASGVPWRFFPQI